MRPGRDADHSPPSSAAVMEEYSYTPTHPLGHAGPVTASIYLLHEDTRFYITHTDKRSTTVQQRTRCCISMATLAVFVLQLLTRWRPEHATILRYTYTASLIN